MSNSKEVFIETTERVLRGLWIIVVTISMTFPSSSSVPAAGLSHTISHKVCCHMALDTARTSAASSAKVNYTGISLTSNTALVAFFVPDLYKSTWPLWLQVHHIHSRSTMFRNQIPQTCLTAYLRADSRIQIKPSSPAPGTCMPSAAPWTDPSPSGSARTPGCQWARSGHATAGARARPAARGRPGGRGRQWRLVLLASHALCGCYPCRRIPRSWGTCAAGAGRRRRRRRRWRGPARRRPR